MEFYESLQNQSNIQNKNFTLGDKETESKRHIPIATQTLSSPSPSSEAEYAATLPKEKDFKYIEKDASAKLAAVSQTINDLKQLQEILPDLQIPDGLLFQLEALKATFETPLGDEEFRAAKVKYRSTKKEIAQTIGSWEAQRSLKASIDVDAESVDSKEYGFKFSRLIEQINFLREALLPGVEVPRPKGVSNSQLHAFLSKVAPQIDDLWQNLDAKFSNFKSNKDPKTPDSAFLQEFDVINDLAKIQSLITDAFERAVQEPEIYGQLQLDSAIEKWLQELKKESSYLMVRSSGAEDTRATANAGGNVSVSYVAPEISAICRALSKVVVSYYGSSSLQNRLNADENPFATKQHLAVCLQELIGETPLTAETISSINPADIPVSLVLFSNEPTYVGDEPFRIMRISATYGHGEGVVGAAGVRSDTIMLLRSDKHPERLYIIEEINGKPQRLAPVQDLNTGEIQLRKVKNPEGMATTAALNEKLLTQLFYLGVAVEKVYKNHPMDMELVIKKGKIYPVQARPVNRPSAKPTYLDWKKVEAAAKESSVPKIQRFDAEAFLPGRAQAQVISSPKEVLITETLEGAEKAYKKGKHKLVVVRQEEPANSHPVVNFSGMGIPVLYCDTLEELTNFAAKASSTTPLISCVQTGKLMICPEGLSQKPEDFISSGYTVHPARVAISTDRRTRLTASSQPGDTALPQEIKSALMQLRALESHQSALAAVKQLKASLASAMAIKKEKLIENVGKDPTLPYAHELLASIQAWEQFSQGAFSELKKSLKKDEGRLEILWHAKIVEQLTLQSAASNSVGRLSFVNIDNELKAVDKIARYRAQFIEPEKTLFSEQMLDGDAAFTSEQQQSWSTFLTALETASQEHQLNDMDVSNMKAMLQQLRQLEMLPLWMLRFFLPAAQKLQSGLSEPAAAVQLLRELSSAFPTNNAFLLQVQELNDEIAGLEENSADFATSDGFKRSWLQLKKLSANFISLEHLPEEGDPLEMIKATIGQSPWQQQLATATPLEKIAAYQLMEKFVTLYDHSIKAIKGSQQYNDEVKVTLFKKMLPGYFTLLCDWQLNLVGSKMGYHLGWPLETYLATMQKCFEKASISSETLRPSSSFDVSAARLGPKTAFGRSLPKTLEDFFTLTHQNLITAVQVLLNGEMEGKTSLPEAMARSVEQFSLAFDPVKPVAQISGYQCNADGIELHYNYPLRNHSAAFVLKFDKKSQACTCEIEFLGESRDRWELIGNMASLYDSLGIVELTKAPDIQPMSLKYTFNMSDPEKSACAASLLKLGAELTFEAALPHLFTDPKLMVNLLNANSDEQYQLIHNHFKAAIKGNFKLPKDFPESLISKALPMELWPEDLMANIKNDKTLLRDALKRAPAFYLSTLLASVSPEKIDEEIALLAVNRSWRVIEKLPEPWKSSPQIILAALTQSGLALKHAGKFQEEREIILAAVKKDGAALEFAGKFQEDREIVLAAVKKDGAALQYAKKYQDDPDIVYAAVKKFARALRFAGPETRKNKKIVLEAVNRDGRLCEEANSSFKTDREVALAAAKTRPLQVFEWFDPVLQNDKEIALTILTQKAIPYEAPQFAKQILAKTDLRNDREVVLAAIRVNANLLKDTSTMMKNDPEIVRIAIKNNPELLEHASPKLQRDPEIVLLAVKMDGKTLRFAPMLNNNLTIVRAAVAQDGGALQYASDKARDDIETVLIAIRGYTNVFNDVGPIARKDERVLLELGRYRLDLALPHYKEHSISDKELLIRIAVQKPSNLFEYATEALMTDRDLIREIINTQIVRLREALSLFGDDKAPFESEAYDASLTEVIPDELMKDRDYIISLIKENPVVFKSLTLYHNDPEIALVAIEQDPEAIIAVDPQLKNEEQFLREAIARNSMALKAAINLQSDRELVASAVKNNGLALQYAPAYSSDEEIVLSAIAQNAQALQYASASFKENKNFMLKVIKLNPKALEQVPKHWLTDTEFVLAAIEQDSSLWSKVSEELYLMPHEQMRSLFELYSKFSKA